MNQLPWILLGLRITPKEDLDGVSPAEMVYGQPLTIPGDVIQTGPQEQVSQHLRELRAQVKGFRPKQTSAHGETTGFHVPKALETAQYVYIRRPEAKKSLQTPYTGPYAVVARNDKWFDVQLGTRTERISIDRLKIAHVAPGDVKVAQPPLRGRPPRATTAAPALSAPGAMEDHGPTKGQPLFPAPPSETRNGSLPPSAPKTPPKTSCTGNGSLPPSAPKTPPTYTQMTASTESDRSQTTDSIISETTREAYKQTSVITRLLYIVLYHFCTFSNRSV